MTAPTLADARRALAQAETLAATVEAHPTPAGAEALRMAADRVLAAGSLWARSGERAPRSLADARRICKAAAALRDRAEGVRTLSGLARLGTLTVAPR